MIGSCWLKDVGNTKEHVLAILAIAFVINQTKGCWLKDVGNTKEPVLANLAIDLVIKILMQL